MARTTFRYNLSFTLDPDRQEGHEEPVNLDGRRYRLLIVPDDGSINFSEGIQKRAEQITLGPRGGGCPCCGK